MPEQIAQAAPNENGVPATPEQTSTQDAQSQQVEQRDSSTQGKDDFIPKKRFNEVYYQKSELERQNKALQEQLDAQRARQDQQTPTPAQKWNDPGAPTLDQYDYDEVAFADALVDYKLEKRLRERDEKDAQRAADQEAKIKNDKFGAQAIEYANENQEYFDLVTKRHNVNYSKALYDSVLTAGPGLDHYLLSNPLEVERLNRLSPIDTAIEVGKLTAKLTPPKKNITLAPDAINVNQGQGAQLSHDDVRYSKDVTPEQYYAESMRRKTAR